MIIIIVIIIIKYIFVQGVWWVVRAFGHDATGRRIDPSWGWPIELFLVPASGPWLV